MDTIQTDELTYTKVNDIDLKLNEVLDLVTDINPESSTTLKDLTSQVKTTTDSINTKVTKIKENTENLLADHTTLHTNISIVNSNLEDLSSSATTIMQTSENNSTKLDTIIQNLENQTDTDNTSVDFSSIEEKIDNVNTNIDTINTNITDMASDVTTTNSNVATVKTNVATIKTNVDTIQKNLPSNDANYRINQKLDEILRFIKTNAGEEPFSEDPFKLNLPYTERLETNRNPSNYDSLLMTNEFTHTKHFFCLADCTGTTFDVNINFTFTCDVKTNVGIYMNNNYYNLKSYEPGTHTISISEKNLTVKNGIIVIYIISYEIITTHQIFVELFGENILIVPKQKKYNIAYTRGKIGIAKVENNNAYYLNLLNDELTPSALNRVYTLDHENVKVFDYAFQATNRYNKFLPLDKYSGYITDNYGYKYKVEDNYDSAILQNNLYIDCCTGYSNMSYIWGAYLVVLSSYKPTLYTLKYTSAHTKTNTKQTYLEGQIASVTMAKPTNHFDSTERNVYILTTIKGINHIYINSTSYLDIGYGNYTTAFFDKNDPLKLNVYMNDNGYCVKKVVQLYSDNSTPTLLTQEIIGTYDAYFETATDAYLVEKDKHLYVFKNNLNK